MSVTRDQALAIITAAVGDPSSGEVAEALAVLRGEPVAKETRVTKAAETR